MSGQQDFQPLKVVFPRREVDFVRTENGGGGFDPLQPVTDELRGRLSNEVRNVNDSLSGFFDKWADVPGVARVKLKEEALAKSKRPSEILNVETCPIIGCERPGELLISVTSEGLERLRKELLSNITQEGMSHISTFDTIAPYELREADPEFVEQDQTTKNLNRLRCRLFRHDSEEKNRQVDARFKEYVKECGIPEIEELQYGSGVKILSLTGVDKPKLLKLKQFAGLQSVSGFPNYKVVRKTSHPLGGLVADLFPPPDPAIDYPVVGIIDSGTDPSNKYLQRWVVDRLDYVPLSQQDNEHGSFVAGLIANAHFLNHKDPRFPNVSCKIVDVAALDKDGGISEYDLLTVIDKAIEKWPEVRVWNLSLGLDGEVCQDHEFSLLAAALDQRMEDHGILFVIAAGNYQTPPYRSWPPQSGLFDNDRISPPADAIRGLTVGGIAHLDKPTTLVKANEPSPFSRRGPGPAYVQKPEICFPSGNCDQHGSYIQTGVISVLGANSIAEDIGTSFATPVASALAGRVLHELDVGGELASPSLAKGLIIHSAFTSNRLYDADEIHYFGSGSPQSPERIVQCLDSEATVIIQAPVRPNPEFGKRPFPIPPCLETADGLKCEIFMTLLYDPPLDRAFGIEYCRCNVTASLGTVDPSKSNKYTRQVHPIPERKASGFEKDLVKHGFKWSPLKFYYRKFSKKGPVGKIWRLTFDMLNRAEHFNHTDQNVILIITVRSTVPDQPVYTEMVQAMDRLAWGASDLKVRSRNRVR